MPFTMTQDRRESVSCSTADTVPTASPVSPNAGRRVARAIPVLGALAAAALTAHSPDSARAAVIHQMPFECNTVMDGNARAGHKPANSIDFNGPAGGNSDMGTPVVASAAGRVLTARYDRSTGYGYFVVIEHGGEQSLYAHLQASLRVRSGDRVKAGQRIGGLGNSSAKYRFPAHLHYEQKRGGSTVKSRFGGQLAPVYSAGNFGRKVRMRSRNCAAPPKPATPPKPPAPPRAPASGPYVMKATVPVRSASSTTAAEIGKVWEGESVVVLCQAAGSEVAGSPLWDYIQYYIDGTRTTKRGYVPDFYVKTFTSERLDGVPFRADGRCAGTPDGNPQGFDGTKATFIRRFSPLAQRSMRTTGVPASFTIAQAAIESTWGTKTFNANNFFGMKCPIGPSKIAIGCVTIVTHEEVNGRRQRIHDEFRTYRQASDSVRDQADQLRRLWPWAFTAGSDGRAFARLVQTDRRRWATSSTYARDIIRTIDANRLDRYDAPAPVPVGELVMSEPAMPEPTTPEPAVPAPATPDPVTGVRLPTTRIAKHASVQTDNGMPVAARLGPRTSAPKVREFTKGDPVGIVCQTRGERVTGKYGTSDLWNLVSFGDGYGAYVTDTYLYTGSDERVAPDC